MTTSISRFAILFAVYVSLSAPAYAYLDGATGSIILQAAIGVVATWMVYFRLFKAKVSTFLAKIVGKAPAQVDGE